MQQERRPFINEEELLEGKPLREERARILQVLAAALEAVDPIRLLKRAVRVEGDRLIVGEEKEGGGRARAYPLRSYRRVLVVGGGKASAAMARALEEILGDRISDGLVNTKYGYTMGTKPKLIRVREAGHPLPDQSGLAGVDEIQRLLADAAEDDLVICLISGGGSALLPAPAPGIALEEKAQLTELLLRAGATIEEINTVRKHLSTLKGGQLARLAHPAEVVTLILSDVIGDPLDVIASGPTVPDPTTFEDAYRILRRYGLWERAPKAVKEHISRGRAGELPETPKEGDPCFTRVYNLIIGGNRLALEAALEEGRRLGFNVLLLSSFLQGEAREVGKLLGAIAKEVIRSGSPAPRPALIVAGGETTVTVRGRGRGGRNQELALSAAIELASTGAGLDRGNRAIIASLATDGTDGPTEAAGGLVDGYTVARAKQRGLEPRDYLDNNDSYSLLRQTGDLIVTGPTNTNVNDLMLVAVF